jgi:hypothetical protein
MLIVCNELDKAARTGLEGLTGWCNDFEIDAGRAARCDGVDFPG